MEGILNDGRQIALASLGKSLNERNAQQNEISSKIQQVTEMSKLQENTLTRKRKSLQSVGARLPLSARQFLLQSVLSVR